MRKKANYEMGILPAGGGIFLKKHEWTAVKP
jgi:hypothetical protein